LFGIATGNELWLGSTENTTFPFSLYMVEDAGTFAGTSNNKVFLALPLTNGTTTSTFRFRTTDSSTGYVYYDGLVTGSTSYSGYEPTFVSERGTKVTSVGTSDAAFKVAKRIGKPSFTFALADTSATTSGEESILQVGDSKVFGGVTVKVKAIDPRPMRSRATWWFLTPRLQAQAWWSQ